MSQKNFDKIITEALAIEGEEAKKAGALGYMARALVQATLPHSKVEGNEYKRFNGLFQLTLLADSEVGLPYGGIPRLLLSWISTEAVRTKSRHLILGRTLTSFMAELDLTPNGGRWGAITRLKEQMKRLFACSISCTYSDGDRWAIKNINPVSKADLWWNPRQPNQSTLIESTLSLNEDFFREIITNPVPIDLRILKALKRSPLALDIYCWITHRVSYLKKPTTIPWGALQVQFGSNYANNAQGVRNFKRHFLKELHTVHCIYNAFKAENREVGLTIKPSKPHISMQKNNSSKAIK